MSREQEALVIKHDAYARNVAAKTAQGLPSNPAFSVTDAIQEGKLGLIRAAQRFDAATHDSARGTFDNHFKSFAYPHIRGKVIDASRKATFVRRRGIEQGIEISMIPLDRPLYNDEGHPMPEPLIQLTAIEPDLDAVLDFEAALADLNDTERRVVMSIGAGITGKELALDMGVSESRVSQIATTAKGKLRAKLLTD